MVTAVIEIPKGDSIRRHYNKSQNRFVELGPIKNLVPVNNGIMPVNYGFIPNTQNPEDNDELDILVLSQNTLTVGQKLEVTPFAILRRKDGDDKIVAIDDTMNINSWEDINLSQRESMLNYFGYKSAIVAIGSKDETEHYIQRGTNS